jgi:hypothetical protein
MSLLKRALMPCLLAGLLVACGSKPDTDEAAGQSTAGEESALTGSEAAPTLALLDACHVKMTQPEPHEWDTKWDPAHIQTQGANPSGLRSAHWGTPEEQRIAADMGNAIPFDLVCGSSDSEPQHILLKIVAFDSSPGDIPLKAAEYRIAPKASPAKNKPGEFIVAGLFLGESMFEAKSGTLKLSRFDAEGAAGSFVIDGNEILMGSRPLHVEGTFDMPCRMGLTQGGCRSNKAEQPH